MLVTVSAFREPYEAHLFRGRLEAEGLVAFVSHEMNVANAWHRSVALGGVKVQVSSDEIELAREVERACSRGEYREQLREEFGDLDDPVCPACGSTTYRQRRPFLRAALAIIVSLTLDMVVPPSRWIHRCEDCRREYIAPHRAFSCEKWLLCATVMMLVALVIIVLLHWLHSVFGCDGMSTCR